MILVVSACPLCGKASTVEVPDTPQAREWLEAKETGRVHQSVQDVFPTMSAADREVLLSGCHDECFNTAFPEDDDDS